MVRSVQRRMMIALMLAAGVLLGTASTASAVTRVMRNRPALVGQAVVLWGNTTQPDGTPWTLDCGNGVTSNGVVADESYISRQCTYASVATFTASLTVGAEVATVQIGAVNPAAGTEAHRNARINMAIEDGLRFLYFSQFDRANRYATNLTSWRNANGADDRTLVFTALAVLAMQNHGHSILADPNIDLFQPVVQRGLNWVFDKIAQRDLAPCAEPGGDPCVNVPAPVNIGLVAPAAGEAGYATPILAAAVAAAAGASPARLVSAGLGVGNANFVAGKTYAEVLQRISNAITWGQSDSGLGRGGWYYSLEAGSSSDGSTNGWGLLGLIDAAAGGANVPAFARTEFAVSLANQINNNGGYDYQVDGNPASTASNVAKTGIRLQGLAFTNVAVGDARVTNALAYITRNWNAQVDPLDFTCSGGSPTNTNKGCGYAMFNVFKGLRLYGITTLPGIGRPAGPGAIPADDWYADYVDNLLTNQHVPTDPARGEWSTAAPSMGWSCCETDTTGITSMALLILAPVAFVPPDPVLFSTVGLSPQTATNPIKTSHTVTAKALAANKAPVPGAIVDFRVLTGPNAGKTGQDVTDANGEATFTYSDDTGMSPGMDTIQAFIGTLGSNQVTKNWVIPTTECDVDADNDVDMADLTIIRNANGVVAGPNDARDPNRDGRINVADVRYCQVRLTK